MAKTYTPSIEILEKYADVLVNYALNSGAGVKKGEVVICVAPDVAKPLLLALQNTLLKAGAYPMIRMSPTGFNKDFYILASEDQLKFFPKKYLLERINLIDHQIGIIADVDPFELKDVDPKKLIMARESSKPYKDKLFEKESKGKFTWTLGLWGTPNKAKEVNLSYEEYWEQIIQACFLDKPDPIKEWKNVASLQKKIITKINNLRMEYIHFQGEDMDITHKLGENRIWLGGSGRNIPSFEIFTSPDWRGTNGWIKFNEPLYRYGNVLKEVYLEFKDGLVVKAKAKQGEKMLQEMVKGKNADKVGEISLTDNRMSRITHPMAETLFDENMGGPFGNTHLAIGSAYHDTFRGDQSKPTKKDWQKMGFNDSAEHTDIISTTNRTVTATLPNGKQKIIYQNGQFTL
jgi:aminopeptidase